MSSHIFGIFGYEFTRSAMIGDIEIIPLYSYEECRRLAEDQTMFHLTGYGVIPAPRTPVEHVRYVAEVRRLADGMTFCQQQHVLATAIIELSAKDSVDDLVQPHRLGRSIDILHRRDTLGPAIQSDTWALDSRVTFLRKFITVVGLDQKVTPLTNAFYRQIEIHRLFSPLVELQHFLAWSGLEILARAYARNRDNGNAAVPITNLLRDNGFDVNQSLLQDWAGARNSAFHQGVLNASPKTGHSPVNFGEHLYALETLLCDVLLKRLQFDDGTINWDRWRDHQPFC